MYVGGQGGNRQAQGWCWIVEDSQATGKLLVRACACVCVWCGSLGFVVFSYCLVSCIRSAAHCNTFQHTATHCHALQHTATHFNALQHFFDIFPSLLTFLAFLRAPATTSRMCPRHCAWRQVIIVFDSLQLTATPHSNSLQHISTHTHARARGTLPNGR